MAKKQLNVKYYCQSIILGHNNKAVDLTFNNLTDLTRLITFFILILLHTVSKIGRYGLLYILTLHFKRATFEDSVKNSFYKNFVKQKNIR